MQMLLSAIIPDEIAEYLQVQLHLPQTSFPAIALATALTVATATPTCGRIGYTGPTGRTGPSPDPSDPTAYCTHTSLALLLASSSRLVEVNPSF